MLFAETPAIADSVATVDGDVVPFRMFEPASDDIPRRSLNGQLRGRCGVCFDELKVLGLGRNFLTPTATCGEMLVQPY